MAMIRKQFFIEAESSRRLRQAATAQGVSEAEIIRDAIAQKLASAQSRDDDWRQGLSKLSGAWSSRDDMPDLVAELRQGWGRRAKRFGLKAKKS